MLTIGVTYRNVMVYTCSRSYLLHGNKLIDVQLGLRIRLGRLGVHGRTKKNDCCNVIGAMNIQFTAGAMLLIMGGTDNSQIPATTCASYSCDGYTARKLLEVLCFSHRVLILVDDPSI